MLCTAMLVYSCDSYTGAGAFSGAQLGSILGSAIGGISDGPRGSDWGTIVGMASGAAIGAAIGNVSDQRQAQRMDEVEARRSSVHKPRINSSHRYESPYSSSSAGSSIENTDTAVGDYGSGYDANNQGDDRIYDFTSSDYTGNNSTQKPTVADPMNSSVQPLAKGMTYSSLLDLRNARFIDANQNGIIERGELCRIIFEVYNVGKMPVYDVQPTVVQMSDNRHIFVSPNMHVEKIMPGKGIRYTALIQADNRLKDGSVKFCVSVVQGNRNISKVNEFNIPTSRSYFQRP